MHILLNNAALPGLERTPRGHEMHVATDILGHFALMTGLRRSLASAGATRVVSVSSSAHLLAPVLFDDPHFNSMLYGPFAAYGQSRTACALLAH